MGISAILLIVAFICFLIAATGITIPRLNMMAIGLALWSLAVLLGSQA